MRWNWQKEDWPRFGWDRSTLAGAEDRFLLETGVFLGTFQHLESDDREQITVDAMGTEATTTSEIEGEILDRASVQSSIRKQLGLAVSPSGTNKRVRAAEQGIAEMMVDLYRGFAAPLSDETLFRWHQMVVRGRADLLDVARYRTGEEPMQVVSGAIYNPKVHFEAPPSRTVPAEMTGFVDWFNRTGPGGAEPLPALTRAGIAHLYFVSIHPFEDGNGRVGRAVAEKALAQGRGRPTLIALAGTILARRKGYYAALEDANKANEVTEWLLWFADAAIEAQRRTTRRVEFLIDTTRLLDRLRGRLNARQERALYRLLREGPEGFEGGLSAGNYVTITGASPATATRDLAEMVALGALTRAGERRHARYQLAVPVGVPEVMSLA
jgi:Fic family protein